MSLFEDKNYQYRDTYFVFFKKANRPSADKVQACLADLGDKYELKKVVANNDELDSMSVASPHDFSAMDVVYVEGEEVNTQITELLDEFRSITLTGDDTQKLKQVRECDARFDIYFFEQVGEHGSDDEFLDPGGLLLVMEKLASVCDGIGLDPQSNALM